MTVYNWKSILKKSTGLYQEGPGFKPAGLPRPFSVQSACPPHGSPHGSPHGFHMVLHMVLPQKIRHAFEVNESILPLGVIVRGCLSPEINWWQVQGVSRLSPEISQDWLQL